MFVGLLAFVLSVALLAQVDQPTLTHQVSGFSGEAKAVVLRTEQGSVTALQVGGLEPLELWRGPLPSGLTPVRLGHTPTLMATGCPRFESA